MLARAYDLHPHAFALEIGDAVDGVFREQLEAPDVRARDDGERLAGIHRDQERRREGQHEIRLAPRSQLR